MTHVVHFGKPFSPLEASAKSMRADFILEEKISKIDAWHIELISLAIINQILPNLGSEGKARVEERVLEVTGKRAQLSILELAALIIGPLIEMKGDDPLHLSSDKLALFSHALLLPIRDSITKAFSTPLRFKDDGLTFQLSDEAPTKILEESASKIGFEITPDKVPSKYSIVLRVEKEQSHKNSILIFSLTEKSGEVEFSKQFYTFDEVDKKSKL